MLKAKVFRDIFQCLQTAENTEWKSVVETDPFANNPETSQIGSMMLILNQILRATHLDENAQVETTNEQTLRSHYNIPELCDSQRWFQFPKKAFSDLAE